jgi:B12-binding domain/radical SAM domain protein
VTATLVFSYRAPGKYAFNVLAGALEQSGLFETGALQLRFATDVDQMVAAVDEATRAGGPVAACWSFYSTGFPEAAEELAQVRARAAAPFIALAGGVHASAEPGQVLAAGFDFAAVGEGERTILAVARRLIDGDGLAGIPGLSTTVGGRVERFGKAEPVVLDDFPPFAPGHNRFGAIEITRGCIYACSFCQTPFLNKARFRHRSPANVAHYAGLLRTAGHRDLRFVSPTSLSYGSPDETPNLAAVEELLARVREAMGPEGRIFFGTFPSEVRPEHVTPEAMALLKRWVDNDNLIIGGQSGSERILSATHRGHDVESIVRAVTVAVAGGFQPNVDFILGLPGETPEDAAATVLLMERLASLGARVHTHAFMPLPGTPLKNAPAAQVADVAVKRLEVLTSQGRAYGQWKRQLVVSQAMAKRRDGGA